VVLAETGIERSECLPASVHERTEDALTCASAPHADVAELLGLCQRLHLPSTMVRDLADAAARDVERAPTSSRVRGCSPPSP